MEPKNGPKTDIFPNALLFLHFPWDFSTFSAESPTIRLFFTRGPMPKVLIMRWKRSQPEKQHVMEQVAHNHLPRQVGFHTSSRRILDVQAKRLHTALRTEFCRTMLRSSKCVLQTVSRCHFRKRYQKLCVHTCQYTFVHRSQVISSLLFLCQAELFTPLRHGSANTELIYRKKSSEQEFCVRWISTEVDGFFTLLPFQDSTTQSTDAFQYGMTGFFESLNHFIGCGVPCSIGNVRGFSIPLLFRSRTQTRPVSLQESHRVIRDFFCIRNRNLIFSSSLSNQRRWTWTWRWSCPWTLQVPMPFLFKSRWISWRNCNDENPVKIFHSNSIASPSVPDSSL